MARRQSLKHGRACRLGGFRDARNPLYSAEQSAQIGAFAAISTVINGQIGTALPVGTEDATVWTTAGNTVAHGAFGCAQARMGGGDCGSGFRGGLAGAALSNSGVGGFGGSDPDVYDVVVNTMIHSTIGGIAATAGGGSFADGAQTAAFAYLFNFLAHVHKDLTYRASRMAGLSPLASDFLSGATVMVDFQGPRFGGDLGIEFAAQDAEYSHMHAMCAGGSSPALCDLRIADYRERMWNMKSVAGLAGLLHLYQDSFALGHVDLQPYNGSVDWAHIRGDMSPPPALAGQIIRGSAEIIKNYMNYCQCGPK